VSNRIADLNRAPGESEPTGTTKGSPRHPSRSNFNFAARRKRGQLAAAKAHWGYQKKKNNTQRSSRAVRRARVGAGDVLVEQHRRQAPGRLNSVPRTGEKLLDFHPKTGDAVARATDVVLPRPGFDEAQRSGHVISRRRPLLDRGPRSQGDANTGSVGGGARRRAGLASRDPK